jgi:serine O-acetyltransferase
VSHRLYRWGVPFLPRLISQVMRFFTGIEIHPGAEIGKGFFIDHGMGVVIGETAVIGKNCVMFHNVTIGGTGKHTGKRHPTIGDNVLIGTAATLLGPMKVGDNAKIGAETFIINHDVPDGSTVVGTPGRVVRLNGKRANIKLKRSRGAIEDD